MHVKFVFFDHAKNMSSAEWSFIVANFVTVICGTRVLIRTFQFLEGSHPWNPWKRSPAPVLNFILKIRLRDTLFLELVGLAIGIPVMLLGLLQLSAIHGR